MVKTTFTIFLLFIFINANAQTLFSVSGIIKDKRGVLPGATVFLSNTKAITATNKDGAFELKGISPGTYLLVAKFIGYETVTISANVIDRSIDVNLTLIESSNQLKQVTITADPKWEEHFQEFKKRFLGETPNAKKCEIENKEVLHFHSKLQTLTVSADEFLKINNKALGYEINYLLVSFEFNLKTGIIKYQGYPSFQELKADDEKQSNLWKKNREAAYAGSPTHLMKSIFDSKSYKEGFRIYTCDYDVLNPITDEGQEKPIQVFSKQQVFLDSLIKQNEEGFKSLSFKKSLLVVYTRGIETFDYKNSGFGFQRPLGISMIPKGQLSIISLLEDNLTIDLNGNYSPPDALFLKGYFAWRQIADLTPIAQNLGIQ